MTIELNTLITEALDDLKAQEVVTLNVKDLSDVTDTLVIASGTSTRHVKSLADNVIEEGKKQGFRPIGVEGLDAADWVLVDYGETVVHVMLPQARQFYDLENLWAPMNTQNSDIDTTI
jgi:ribosome-associated protein